MLPGLYVPPHAWRMSLDVPAAKSQGGLDFNGYAVRSLIPAGRLRASGSRVRLRWNCPTTHSNSMTDVYIGRQATSGDTWDFAATPTRVTIGGGNTLTLTQSGADVYSDEILFTFQQGDGLIISYAMAAVANNWPWSTSGGPTGSETAFKSGAASEVATVDVSGYTLTGATQYQWIKDIEFQ